MAVVSVVPLFFEEKDKKTVYHLKMKVGDVQDFQFLVSNYTDKNWSGSDQVIFTTDFITKEIKCKDFGLNKEQQRVFFVKVSILDPIPPQTVKITGYFELKN
jgi:hypothetical protein